MRPVANPQMTYGYICPGCLVRYGAVQAGGAIDVRRCPACKMTLAEVHQHDEAINSRVRHWREKASRK